MNGGAWWAAIYGVAQSRTRLKCLGGHLEMPLAVSWGGGTCAQSCAGLSFAWMFFVEIHLGAIS